jgi:predicted Zn-dependent peptidase
MTPPTTPEFHDPFYYHRLPNGLEMVGQRMPSLGSVVFGIQLDAGAMNEDESELGLNQILDDMLFQGTPTRNARQITDAIELLGARRSGGVGFENARYSMQVVHTRFDQALELWSDILLHPVFPAKEFKQLLPLLIQAIKRREDEPTQRLSELMMRTYYQNSRMARPILGTIETTGALSVDKLQAFYDNYYRADKALFAIAGNFEWEHVVANVTALFGDWAGGGKAAYRDQPQITATVGVEQSEGEQEHFFFGYPSVAYGDPDYYANRLIIEALGGGMTSRLFSEVREKRGLVYSVGAYEQPARSLGSVFIYAGTPPEKARETAEVIVQELGRLQADGLTQDELDRAKIQVKSEVVMQSDSSSARMAGITRSWWYQRKLIPTQEVKAAIDAVTLEQITGVLRRYPPTQPLSLAMVGPAKPDEVTKDLFPSA